jgi:hypothetical protein
MAAVIAGTRLETLESEKLSLIIALHESMLELTGYISEDGIDSAAPVFFRQEELKKLIVNLNEQIRRLPSPCPEERDRLETVVAKQRMTLLETARLSQELIQRGKDLKKQFSEKIRSANRAKSISRQYHTGAEHAGFLLDCREV